jgi:hypothetical protein
MNRLWDRFWFEADCVPQMRLFRSVFAILLFCCYLVRTLDLNLFYSDGGLLVGSSVGDVYSTAFRPSLFLLFPGQTFLWVANGVFLLSLLSLAAGFLPRISALLALILHVSFLHRNLGVHYGADTISTFFLLYLCGADYRAAARDLRSSLGSMVFRLAQIQVCVIYAYSGLYKLRGLAWWRGEGVWDALANSQMARWDFSWLSHFPLVLTAMSFLSLFWEVYFPVLVWVKPVRYPLLVFGVLFHLGIAVSINIPFFGLLMIILYILFLDAPHCIEVGSWVKKVPLFLKVAQPAAEKNIV